MRAVGPDVPSHVTITLAPGDSAVTLLCHRCRAADITTADEVKLNTQEWFELKLIRFVSDHAFCPKTETTVQ